MSSAESLVVCIGDALVDQVNVGDASHRFAGGGALNAAVALSRLGVPAALVADIGWDSPGQWLRACLRSENVTILPHPTVDFTGLAVSDRTQADPSYRFGRFTIHRAIRFNQHALAAVASAKAVAVSTYAFGDPKQVEALEGALLGATGFRVIDPNPRPAQIVEKGAYVRNLERVMPLADLLKLSVEDAHFLYGQGVEEVARRVLELGASSVLVTKGPAGASILTSAGTSVDVGIPDLDGAIVDTMGAGDAALAAVVARVVESGVPSSSRQWEDALRFAMLVAGLTCRRLGGATAAPRASDLSRPTPSGATMATLHTARL